MKASDLRLGSPQNMLFKGPFGFGKTLAAASFALEGPVYLSYWDKKRPIELATFFTEKRFGKKAQKILDNIEFDVYNATNPHEYLNWLIARVNDCRYTAIINDSLTFMTTSTVGWSLNFDKPNKVNKDYKDVVPDWDEYKVETSLVSQCLEISKKLPCHVIWTAHPLPSTRVEAAGATIKVSKVNSLVSYGSKVAGIVPGAFTEIYHFSQQSTWSNEGKGSKKFICELNTIGDEFAKSPLIYDTSGIKELDFTDRLFYEVWKEAIDKAQTTITEPFNPFEQKEPTELDKANNPSSRWK